MTIGQAAERLLALRVAIAESWPTMQVAAGAGRLAEADRIAWNRAVWLLIDQELRLVETLQAEEVQGPDGQPLGTYATDARLLETLRVGYFAGAGTPPYAGALGEPVTLAGAILAWLAVAVGVTLAAAVAYWLYSRAAQNVSAAALDEAEASLLRAVAAGEVPPEAIESLTALQRERRKREETQVPGWAKGIAVVAGVGVVGYGLIRLIAAIPRRRTALALR